MTSTAGKCNRAHGFTYIIVLITIAVVSIMAQVATATMSTAAQRNREMELLFRGNAYRQAIRAYYEAKPEAPEYPARLRDLALDPRFLHKRHIRQLYEDPMGERWRILRNAQGRIVGVASSSDKTPIKTKGFPGADAQFEDAKHYSEWEFTYYPGQDRGNVNSVTKRAGISP